MNVKTYFILVVFSFLTLPTCFAQLQWEKDTIDYKANPDETEFKTQFKFTNKSAKQVNIIRVMSTCGCTSALQSKSTYAPGEAGSIDVKFDFGNRFGPQSKQVTVATDEPATYKLNLNVNIPQVLYIYPNFVIWSTAETMDPKPVYIKVLYPSAIHLLKAVSSNPAFSGDLRTIKDGAEYLFLVSPPKDQKPASARFQITSDFPQKNPRVITVNTEVKAFPPSTMSPPVPTPGSPSPQVPPTVRVVPPPHTMTAPQPAPKH